MKKISSDFKLFISTAIVIMAIILTAKFIYFEFIYRNL